MKTPIQRIQRGRVTWLAAGEEGRALVTASEPDLAALNEREARRVKTSRVRTVWRLPGYSVKEYRAWRVGDRLAALIRGSRAMVEWRVARRLTALGVPTFEPIAVGEERHRGLLTRSILVTRAVRGTVSLGEMPTSRGVVRIQTWRVKALAVAELDRPDHHRWLCDPEVLMTSGDVEVVKTEAGATVVCTDLRDETGARRVYVKRIPVRTWRGGLRRSLAMRAWRRGRGMLNRALPTAQPLAVVNRRWGPFVRCSYLVTEAVPDAVSLYDLLSRPTLTGAQASVLAAALGRLVARMHEAGFSHRDLKLVNILARLEGGRDGPAEAALWLIDLDSAQRHRGPVRPRQCVRDVARLLLAARRFERGHSGVIGKDACRAFLDVYLGPWAGPQDRTAWCRRVQRRTRRLATERRKRRDGSRGRRPHTEPPT